MNICVSRNNRITAEGAVYLAKGLMVNTCLQVLKVRNKQKSIIGGSILLPLETVSRLIQKIPHCLCGLKMTLVSDWLSSALATTNQICRLFGFFGFSSSVIYNLFDFTRYTFVLNEHARKLKVRFLPH